MNEVVNDPKVIEAYLGKKAEGEEEDEIQRAARMDGR